MFFAGAGGLFLALLTTPACRWLARGLGVVAHPRQDRWHRKPTALLGGPAMAIAWVLILLALGLFRVPMLATVLCGAAALLLVGLVDDVRPFGAPAKLVATVLVGAGMVALGLELRVTHVAVVDALITLAWIVTVTNAFNLLDNMDGLAAGIAAIAAALRLVFFLMDGNVEGAAVCAGLAGVTLGFLVYNSHPASIFMGDAGSLFLGSAVSGLSLIGGYPYSRGTLSVVLFPALVLLVPIFDTTLVTVTRFLRGRPIFQGGQDHTSHRLVALGLSERRAVWILYAVALSSGGVALTLYRFGLDYAGVAIGLIIAGLGSFAVTLSRLNVYPDEPQTRGENPALVKAWSKQ
jgi:UDP-GlcNAc:undecaprenyl-phosphate GlcNAc-1-phosphate transferase